MPRLPFQAMVVLCLALVAATARGGDTTALEKRLQEKLAAQLAAGDCPGAALGVVLPDGAVLSLAAGQSDREQKTPMRPSDLLLAGSVGKTFFAAVAMQLVSEGKLSLDELIEVYLGDEPWFDRLPNASEITVRMLMNHTSGLVRYELNERFLADLSRQPDRVFKPAEELGYLLDTQAPFAAGKGWDYSDTNYIVLGMILEKVSGASLYGEVERRLLKPLKLTQVVPSVSRSLPGLVQGYAGQDNPFGHTDAMIRAGKFAINPQFEWAGGGFATSATDLARWAKALYEWRAFDAALAPQFVDGVEAKMLGAGARYGLGVIVRKTPLGTMYGHSGFFPGYQAEMRYYLEPRFAIAMQVNTSVMAALRKPLGALVQELAQIVAAAIESGH